MYKSMGIKTCPAHIQVVKLLGLCHSIDSHIFVMYTV